MPSPVNQRFKSSTRLKVAFPNPCLSAVFGLLFSLLSASAAFSAVVKTAPLSTQTLSSSLESLTTVRRTTRRTTARTEPHLSAAHQADAQTVIRPTQIAITSGSDANLDKASSSESVQEAMMRMNQEYASTVIIPTYTTLESQTQALSQQSEAFWKTPTEANLASFTSAWEDVATTWAHSGAFAFGPVHSLGYSADLESPSDTAGIDQLLATSTDLQSLEDFENAALHPSLRGLEAIAYLLGNKAFDEFSAQERLYLHYLSVSANEAASELRAVWQEGWNGYAPYQQALATAGESGNVFYLSPQAASEEIIRSLINNLAVVTLEVLPEQLAVETTSNNVVFDVEVLRPVVDGVEGLQSAYLGRPSSLESSPNIDISTQPATAETLIGVSSFVAIAHPEAHPKIQQGLASAIDNLNQTIAEPSDTEALETALSSLITVQEQLETVVLPMVLTSQNQADAGQK